MAIPHEGYNAMWGCSYFWRAPPASVNGKPFLNENEERLCNKLYEL
jgi:hypothetical protein